MRIDQTAWERVTASNTGDPLTLTASGDGVDRVGSIVRLTPGTGPCPSS